jgi:hypothetical protein
MLVMYAKLGQVVCKILTSGKGCKDMLHSCFQKEKEFLIVEDELFDHYGAKL